MQATEELTFLVGTSLLQIMTSLFRCASSELIQLMTQGQAAEPENKKSDTQVAEPTRLQKAKKSLMILH